MTLDEYYQLLSAGQQYVRNAQAADPEWQEWQRIADTYTPDMGGAPASPTTDYWGKYMATLSPQQQAEFAQTMAQLKDDRWQTSVGNVMQYIPAAVGAVGLAGMGGLLGPSAGFPGTSIFAGLGEAGAAAGAAEAATGAGFVGEGALSGVPLWDGALAGAGAAGAGSSLLTGAGKALAGAASSVLTGGSGGSGGSAFRNTLTGEVTGDQENLNSQMYKAMGDQLAFNREQFDYYKGLSDRQYQLGQNVFDWNQQMANDAKARADRFDNLYFDTTGRQLRQFSADVDKYDSPAEGLRMSGRAMADVEGQLDNARGAQIRGLTSRGWNPNAAALQSSMGDMELQGALAKASASTMAFEAAKREGLNLRAMAAGLGQPNANVATANTGLSGQLSSSGLDSSVKSMQPGFTNLGLYNQGQGVGVNWGNAANSGYNAMRTGNSSWSDNLNYGGALLGGLRGYATGGTWGGLAGAIGGLTGWG